MNEEITNIKLEKQIWEVCDICIGMSLSMKSWCKKMGCLDPAQEKIEKIEENQHNLAN